MLDLFHLENSRSFRVCWLLEELGHTYNLHKFKRVGGVSGPDFKAACGSPMLKSPVIHDRDFVITESGAICQYLIRNYGAALSPLTEAEIISNDEWFQFSEGTFCTHAIAILYARWNLLKVDHSPAGLAAELEDRMSPNVHKDIDHIERTLIATGGYLVRKDEMMAADIMVGWSLDFIWIKQLGVKNIADLAARWPQSHAWLEKLKARPAYARAMLKSDDDLTRAV